MSVKQSHDKFFGDAQAKLKDTALVSAQLGVLNEFVDGAATANERVNLILGQLSSSTISDDQYKLIKRDWMEANDFLTKIGKISDPELAKVKEITLWTQLKQIRDIASKNAPDVAFSVDHKNYSDLKAQLQAVSQLLDGIANIVTVQISMLQDDMADVAKMGERCRGLGNSPI